MEANRKFIKALEVKDFDQQLYPGDTIKIYSKETKIIGFSAQFNDGIERWETVIHTTGRGDPFERSLDVIEVLQEQPRSYEERANTIKEAQQGVWVKASEQLPEPNKHMVIKIGIQYYGAYYSEAHKMIYSLLTHHYWSTSDNDLLENIEWLDESATSNYSALKERAEKMEAALQAIVKLADRGIFPDLAVESMGAQMCIEIDKVAREALAWKEGEKEEGKPCA